MERYYLYRDASGHLWVTVESPMCSNKIYKHMSVVDPYGVVKLGKGDSVPFLNERIDFSDGSDLVVSFIDGHFSLR